MSLEKLLATNVFSHMLGGVRREYVPFNEALTAKVFADAINGGKMSVEDAWIHFWSYEESSRFTWALQADKPWRAMLPAWADAIEMLLPQLTVTDKSKFYWELASNFLIMADCCGFDSERPPRAFIPFTGDMWRAIGFEMDRNALEQARGREGTDRSAYHMRSEELRNEAAARVVQMIGYKPEHALPIPFLMRYLYNVYGFAIGTQMVQERIQAFREGRETSYTQDCFDVPVLDERGCATIVSKPLSHDIKMTPEEALREIEHPDDSDKTLLAAATLYEDARIENVWALQDFLFAPKTHPQGKFWSFVTLLAIHSRYQPRGYNPAVKTLVV